jgi:hypothetical protein
MSKLKTIKGKAKLSEFTDYVAIKANKTRWAGNYRMVRRFLQFQDSLNNLVGEGGLIAREVALPMSTALEVLDIEELSKALTQFHSVSLLLQKRDGEINLDDVRNFFDSLIEDYGVHFSHHLEADSDIVCSPVFERAIIKLLNNESLTGVRCLKQSGDASVEVEVAGGEGSEDAYAVNLLMNARKRRRITTKYIEVSELPITSNIVERFFSQVKLNLMHLRNNLLPSTLGILMFLRMNRHLWGPLQVQQAIAFVGADE